MQTPGTIPDDELMAFLNSKPPYYGPMKVAYEASPGSPLLVVEADLYGRAGKVEFCWLFDNEAGRPVFAQVDLAIRTLCRADPTMNLESAIWAYEDRTVDPKLNSLVYFFKVRLSDRELSREPAGQLPVKYLALLLGAK